MGPVRLMCPLREKRLWHFRFHLPKRVSPMFGEGIKCAEQCQSAQFFLGERDALSEIIQRSERLRISLPNEFFRVFTP